MARKKNQGRKLSSGLNWKLLHFLVLDKSKVHSHYHIIFIITIISKTCYLHQKHGFLSNTLLKAISYNKAKLDGRWSIVDGQ